MSEKMKVKRKSQTQDSKPDKKLRASKKDVPSKSKGATSAFTLLASEKALDPSLMSLFAVKQPPVKVKVRETPTSVNGNHVEADDEELSSIDEEFDIDETAQLGINTAKDELLSESVPVLEARSLRLEDLTAEEEVEDATRSKRKRKRKAGDEDLEGEYLNRLAREDAKETKKLAAERASKRQKPDEAPGVRVDDSDEEEQDTEVTVEGEKDDDENSADLGRPPKHETEVAADEEFDKAQRTIFLGNVSTAAITSKSARKTLLAHLISFFDKLAARKLSEGAHKLESIRFRSTPYASAIPKKAAYAKQELMDATTKSTNAYAVYSSSVVARQAAKHLNGTMILDRHIRVDEVAHPAPVDHKRCVFVGNLGFVDDESNILDANEEDGREKRKRGKEPADVEEGLWRTFGKCGKVESVRVIRDSTTRVGKGIAYVQFEDENSVEAALLMNEKKFPPMLPRKLRVSRAKAQKRNAKPGSGRPSTRPQVNGGPGTSGKYQRKVTAEEASRMGRAGKLLGRAAAAQMRRPGTKTQNVPSARGTSGSSLGEGIRRPESFVFEGHRAKHGSGKSGLKLGGKGGSGKKKAKVTKRSASFKAKKTTA